MTEDLMKGNLMNRIYGSCLYEVYVYELFSASVEHFAHQA